MRDSILFYVNGRRHQVRGVAAFQPLSTFLRNELGLTGTKVVCAEGDCGSCTVLLGRPRNGALEYRAVCSCIQFLFQADGCHVVTVEGLGSPEQLNPVQSALATHHGTQCGFCTPGLVMSIHALLETSSVLTEERLRQGLVGNLCRCTGYDPILKAAMRIDTDRAPRMNQLFNAAPMLAELAAAFTEPVYFESGEHRFSKPSTFAEAAAFRAAHPESVIVSGGTDLGVQVNKGVREISSVLSTAAIAGADELLLGAKEIMAGANVSMAALEAAAAQALPEYAALLARFGSPQIRNAATLGGNIANGSPIGDSMPALFALDAQIELTGPQGTRWVNINEFFTGYKKTVTAPAELISRVRIPLPGTGERLQLYKVSKRQDLDIATFNAAIWLRLDGNFITDLRIAYGGVAPNIIRLRRTEARLRGASLALETFTAARETALSEVAPISDVRASSEYRNALAANILRKLYYDLSARQDAATQV